jgi:hypothetical protein
MTDVQSRLRFPNPAGEPARPTADAAPRPDGLAGRTVVVIDNGQATIERGTYGEVVAWLTDGLAALQPAATVVRIDQDLVTSDAVALAGLGRRIRDLAPAGVLIALCHAGVTAPSALLAGELERAGVPCVLVCTPLGAPLAGLMASYDVPALPIVVTEQVRGLGVAEQDQLAARVSAEAQAGLTGTGGPRPYGDPAAGLDAIEVDADEPAERLWERLLELRLNDGLPILPPTPERIERMQAAAGRDADEVLLAGPTPSQSPITVGKVVLNAVLAGCRPEYLPVVLAAVEAMAADEFRFFQTAITTHPGGVAVAVSGPVAEQLGIASGAGCLGPGFRPNATIGRAISLTMSNIARAIPGVSSLATFGSAAQFTYCFAERADGGGAPWTPYHAETHDPATSTVTVLKCESPHNVISNRGPGAEPLLDTAAAVLATLGTNGIRWPADHLVLINPAQVRMLQQAGYSKRDVQMHLFEKARVSAADFDTSRYESSRPRWTRGAAAIPVVRDPAEFRVFVCGGIGNQMMVAPPWGLSKAVTRAVRTGGGADGLAGA